MKEKNVNSPDEVVDLGTMFYGGGDLDFLRRKNPVPFFDDHVEFYEYLVIDSQTRKKIDFPIDHDTGEYNAPVPDGCEVAEHKYFVDGEPQQGSATGYVHHFFPEFDDVGAAKRISNGNRMLTDSRYKYYRFAEHTCRVVFGQATGLKGAVLEQEFEEKRQCMLAGPGCCAHEDSGQCEMFVRMYRSVVFRSILNWWNQISEEALREGRKMHRSIEMCYNCMYDKDNERFHTPDMKQFARFHKYWVLRHKLVMFRTELSLRHKPIATLQRYLNGTIDAVFLDPDGNVWLVDWKRAKEIKEKAFRKDDMGTGPCYELANCNREHYNMQLNVYRYVVEKNTHFRVVRCYLAVFHPNYIDYETYLVPNYQQRVAEAMRHFEISAMENSKHACSEKS